MCACRCPLSADAAAQDAARPVCCLRCAGCCVGGARTLASPSRSAAHAGVGCHLLRHRCPWCERRLSSTGACIEPLMQRGWPAQLRTAASACHVRRSRFGRPPAPWHFGTLFGCCCCCCCRRLCQRVWLRVVRGKLGLRCSSRGDGIGRVIVNLRIAVALARAGARALPYRVLP
jgi:hypothetical protein